MDTINISLPTQLKAQAEALIDQGHYASFSDIVRNALRLIIRSNYYDDLAQEAVADYRKGKTKALRTKKDIDAFVCNAMS